MTSTTLWRLSEERGTPAISLLCPLDVRQPGNTHDAVSLRQLRDEAIKQINGTLEQHRLASLIARLDEALGSVDLEHPSAAVALFVSEESSHVIPLDLTVEPRVVVGERFAVGDLAAAVTNTSQVRALVLSQHKTRCIDITGEHAVERHDHGFPVEVTPPTEADTPHRDFPLDEHEKAEAAKFVFRAVDTALRALEQHDDRPLVLLGTERELAYFEEVGGKARHIIGRVHGNRETAAPVDVAHLVRPVVDEYDRRAQQEACDQAREAIGTHAVSGIADVWQAAHTGRGHCLIVEAGYRYPAHLGSGVLAAAADAPGAVDAVEDAVREVIRHDGKVLVVAAGSIADLDHIALLTRY